MSKLAKITSINNGIAYVEQSDGSVKPMQMVVGRNGVIGAQPIDQHQEAEASIDQAGTRPALPSIKDLGLDQT